MSFKISLNIISNRFFLWDPNRVRVDLGVMRKRVDLGVMRKRASTLPRAPEVEFPHQMQFSVIPKTDVKFYLTFVYLFPLLCDVCQILRTKVDW